MKPHTAGRGSPPTGLPRSRLLGDPEEAVPGLRSDRSPNRLDSLDQSISTLRKTNIDPDNGNLEDWFPLQYQPVVFRVHVSFRGYKNLDHQMSAGW